MRMGGANAILTPTNSILLLGVPGSYVCTNLGENRSRNTAVRVPTDGHTQTHANRFLPAEFCLSVCPSVCQSNA